MYIFLFVLLLVVLGITVYNSLQIHTVQNDLENIQRDAIEQTNRHYNVIMRNLNNKIRNHRDILNNTYDGVQHIVGEYIIMDENLTTELDNIKHNINLLDLYDVVVEEDEEKKTSQ